MPNFLLPRYHAPNIVFAFVSLTMIAACDSSTGPSDAAKTEPVVILGKAALALPVPDVVPAKEALMEGMVQGKMATIHLNRCPSDSAFQAAKPLGSLICGERYNVFWDNTKSAWIAIGPNSALPDGDGFGPTRAQYPGTPPPQGPIVVWGLGFKVAPTLEVSMSDGVVVGTLVHSTSSTVSTPSAPSSRETELAKTVTGDAASSKTK
jgi:hypothetical protein